MPEFFTNYAQPQQRNSLADMVNMASGIQNFQQAQQLQPLQLEKARMEVEQLKKTQPLEAQRLAAEARVAEETALPRISAAESQASRAGSEADVAKLDKFKAFLSNSIQSSAPLLTKKDLSYDNIEKHFKDSLKNVSDDPKMQEQALAQAMQHIPKNAPPDEYRMFVGRQMLQALTTENLVNKLFPTSQALSTGEQVLPVSYGSSLAVQPPGTVMGKGTEMGIPPTTQVVNPAGEARLVGPMSQRGAANMQTGVGPAQAALLAGGGENISKDWQNTTFEAQGAPGRIAVFQNIKKLVPESFTGVGGERKQFLSGLAQAVGIPANVLETSSTDELAKNTKLLQLAGGNTDAARGIAELANPNTKMTKEGILRVTDQLIGMEKMKEAKARYLQPYSQNAPQYQQAMQSFNQVADPRLFQEMSAAEVAKLKASMSEAERAELGQRIRMAKQLGIIK